MPSLSFPTALHQQVARLAGDFFEADALVDTVLVVNSCARGRAVPESDVDLAVLVTPVATAHDVQRLEGAWRTSVAAHPLVVKFRETGRFAQLHVDLFDGRFLPDVWDDGGGPDVFELEIGNRLAHSTPLSGPGDHFLHLRSQWLPYYNDPLRQSRLTMVRAACADDLERISMFLRRDLHFPAFDYLYKAFREFLQALFIARRTYPLSYSKWIREQVADWLALPELYEQLPPLLSMRNIESAEVGEKAAALGRLLDRWVQS
jgi:hypothetical protein